MNKILWDLRIMLSNKLDTFQWYRRFLGGEWYFVKYQRLNYQGTHWVRRDKGDPLDVSFYRCNPFVDILDVEKYE
jgi:hypothetical protein